MNFFRRLVVFLYMLLMVSLGGFLVLASLNLLSPEKCAEIMNMIVADTGYQIAGAVAGIVIILIGIIAPYRLAKRLKRSRFISFQNPDGEVTISLSAVEDYIQKIAKSIGGIKDVKSSVRSGKKGINVTTDVTISASASIPEVTEQIQMEVKNKVQSMLGIEEGVNISMNIKKIIKGAQVEGIPVDGEEKPTASDTVPYRR
ncbi:MAG: alkaline shock response membrane anchor protein AmaP [Candidatus Aadella gelida]|nr:alkaline shock response membrane anchor protein AmaP [Candidatus Aadella gelida]